MNLLLLTNCAFICFSTMTPEQPASDTDAALREYLASRSKPWKHEHLLMIFLDFVMNCVHEDRRINGVLILSILLYTIFSKKTSFFGPPPIFTKRSEYWWWSGCMTGTVMQPRLKLRNNYAVSLPAAHRQSPNKFAYCSNSS